MLYRDSTFNQTSVKHLATGLLLSSLLASTVMLFTPQADAASAAEILAETQTAKVKLAAEIPGAQTLLNQSAGYLVFPEVYEGGIGIGGEYGEGVLMVDGKAHGYYNLVSASYGFKLGGQKKSVFIAFNDQESLNEFIRSDGWEAGVDASVAVLNLGTEGNINTQQTNKPVVGFVADQKGLMYDLSLEGSKITKIEK